MSRLYSIGGTPAVRDIPPPEGDPTTRLVDAFGRRLTYLRVSVTDRCNLRCVYCLPEDAAFPFGDRDFLSPGELESIVGTLVRLGIRRVRITGGEPLVRKDILEIARRLRGLAGLEDLALSTNGTELARLAGALREAGIDRVNISLDTLDPEEFRRITRHGDLERVWKGIEAAVEVGLAPVKLNAVLMARHRLSDLGPLVELTLERPLTVRFIELMPTASNREIQAREYLSCEVAKAWIEERYGRLEPTIPGPRTGPAKTFRIPGARGQLGFITPLSHTFCQDCNRLRLTARGELRLCLFADRVHPLRHLLQEPEPEAALEAEILGLLREKPAEHLLREGDYGNLVSFMQIGG